VQAAPTEASTIPKGLFPQREEKINTHNSQTQAPAVGWKQTTGLTAGHTHQQKLLRGQHREGTLQIGATSSLANT